MSLKNLRESTMRGMILEVMEFSDDPLRTIFEWVQRDQISLKEFKELLEYA